MGEANTQDQQASWTLYLLECRSGALYTGITNNLRPVFTCVWHGAFPLKYQFDLYIQFELKNNL